MSILKAILFKQMKGDTHGLRFSRNFHNKEWRTCLSQNGPVYHYQKYILSSTAHAIYIACRRANWKVIEIEGTSLHHGNIF